MPQGREDAESRIQKLESRRATLQRHRKVAEGLWMGGSREHKKRLEANTTAMESVERELKELQSGQGKMRQRQQTLRELTGNP